ncbi:CpsD/CapB family tyrosine-protein kinase [Erythrobacter sp. sf7]|uniref:CpsD/CapB family tyrosine-protein kinase n=1 Tax=Erythrobacter fulvus TaxID=2987523 RepID=A0ABT5JLI1_9SPHN|nr:CpsD/CapB family tyrosine-protein kinase [Erythrobacter fulvus]MDC8753616.1 CpsD/CapB family tyrosine-protein kinase [Erythrobacter fulvus]
MIPMPEASPSLIGFSERDIRARPFKLLRTLLGRKLASEGYKIIGVTSPSPHAGKSFLASNLAAAMSRVASDKIVLADFDLQRATIAELFGIVDPPGITEYLLGEVDGLPSLVRGVEETNLVIAPSFVGGGNSAELLSGERLAELISGLRTFADDGLVICDLPPLFVSDDALIVAQHLDGIVLVVEQGVTTKRQLETSLQLLGSKKLIGTVFNRYWGGYGDLYGYTDDYGSYYK